MAQYQPLLLILLIAAATTTALISGGVSAARSSSNDPAVEMQYGDGAWSLGQKYDYYKALGEYAVACHNKLLAPKDHQLTFQKVISCDYFPGLTHKLTIAASDGGVTHTYEAVVCYKPLIQYKKLISFKLA